MALVWGYWQWSGRWPSRGGDELWRHTVVLPYPFHVTYTDPENGFKYYPALVIVIAPWWLCPMAWSRDGARYIRYERKVNKMFLATDEDEIAGFDEIMANRPPYPKGRWWN
mgnify:FL=1